MLGVRRGVETGAGDYDEFLALCKQLRSLVVRALRPPTVSKNQAQCVDFQPFTAVEERLTAANATKTPQAVRP
jgi:hypothetical protein